MALQFASGAVATVGGQQQLVLGADNLSLTSTVELVLHLDTNTAADAAVFVAGDFPGGDNFTARVRMTRHPAATGVEYRASVPVHDTTTTEFMYKFVVDGQWVLDRQLPKTRHGGYLNHLWVREARRSSAPRKLSLVQYNNTTRTFHLQSVASSYVMRVTDDGQLVHLHWGSLLDPRDDVGYLNADAAIVSFDAAKRNSMQAEFPDYGTGDFRIPAYRVRSADGFTTSQMLYQSHSIVTHDLIPRATPHFHPTAVNTAETLVIIMRDPVTGLCAELRYTVFADYDSLTRSVVWINRGTAAVTLLEANSATIDFPPAPPSAPYHLTHLAGSWGRERQQVTQRLEMGISAIESRRGASSHQHNPFVVLSEGPLAEESTGSHYAVGLVYGASFQVKVELVQTATARLVVGLHPDSFEWRLEPGQTFATPEAVLSYSQHGMGKLSRQLHRLIRDALLPHATRHNHWHLDRPRPVLVNSWEAMYFNCSAAAIMQRLVEPAVQLGLDMVVLDDGWFRGRHNDTRALGDWLVDEEKFPGGLGALSDKVNQRGLLFGIWMEPEMISVDSDLYRAHPDWCLHVPHRPRTESRNQLVLDMSRPDVQQFEIDAVSRVLDSASIAYLKWDFNRHLTEVGSEQLAAGRQGELMHRWIEGVYRVLDHLTAAYPAVLFESCAGGGGRFDLAMLYFSGQSWTSDNTDALARVAIQTGTSLFYPAVAMAAHVSAVPNHQLHRNSSLTTRHVVAMSGSLGYELDLLAMTQSDRDSVRHMVQLYQHHVAPLVRRGDLYRLNGGVGGQQNHQLASVQAPTVQAWMYVDTDGSRAAVMAVLTSPYEVVLRPARIKLAGLLADTIYSITVVSDHTEQSGAYSQLQGRAISGRTLMAGGVVGHFLGDTDAVMFLLRAL